MTSHTLSAQGLFSSLLLPAAWQVLQGLPLATMAMPCQFLLWQLTAAAANPCQAAALLAAVKLPLARGLPAHHLGTTT
jgi:hypothetical protein